MFKRMSKSDLSKAQRILSWLIGTEGTMTSNMLVEALTIDEDRLEVDKEDRLGNPVSVAEQAFKIVVNSFCVQQDEIRDICRSLVRQSNHPPNSLWPDCKIITLAHSSVEQYLLSPEAKEFRFDLRTIHLQLARACLAYSTSSIWESIKQSAPENDTIPESSGEVVQFLAYTCADIFSHLQYLNVEYELVPYVIGLLQQDTRLKNLQQNCDLVNSWQYSYPFNMSLHISAKDGPWGIAVTHLLEDPLQISHTSSFLSKSVVAGLYATYFSLIEQRIEFDTTDVHYQTPLAFVVATGRIDLIKRYILRYKEQHHDAVTHGLVEAENILVSILNNTINGLFTAIVTRWMDGFRELFSEALKSLDLLYDYSHSSKIYGMLIRLCGTLGAAEKNVEVLAYIRSHASGGGRLNAQALNQLEEELLYVCVCQRNGEYVRELVASGASPNARINLPSTLRLLHQRYTDKITLENVNKYWICYLDSEVLLNEVDTHSRDWEYSEEKPEFITMAAMNDPGIARLLVQGRHEEVLGNTDVLAKAVESWLLITDDQGQADDFEVLRSLLYNYLQKPENKQKMDMALVICSGNISGTWAVTQLLARDADPNCSLLDEDYRDASTPLVAACRCGSYENVKILLDAQADPDLESESGIIPSVAVFASWTFKGGISDRQRIFDLLRQYKPELMTSSKRALSKPSPAFGTSGFGSRPGSVLSAAIMTPLRSCLPLEFLQSNGLLENLNNYLPGDEYGTPLIAAAATGEEDLVNLLLEHGATINVPGHPDTEWSHPALAATYAEHWDLALRFLEDVDTSSIITPAEQRKWSMALMVSLESDNPEVALKLIQGGVNINFASDQEASSFMLATVKESGFNYMVEIRTRLFDMGTPMYAACVGGNPTLIKKLQELEAREEPTPGASSGDCLTAACGSGKVEAVEIFLQRGSNVNKCTPGRERWCPLVSALLSEGYSDEDNIVSLLLSKGARADISYQFENSAVDPRSLETMVLGYGKSLHFSLLWKRMWDDGTITGSSILQAKPFFGNPFIAATVGRDEDGIELIARQEGVDVNYEERCGIYPTAMMATLDMKKSYRVTGPLRKLGATEITANQMLNFSHPFRALTSNVVKNNIGLTVPGSFWGNMITLCVNVEMAIPYLLQQGADPNQVVSRSFYGSALIAASALLRSDTMMHFLDHGCDVNAVVSDSLFGTPLIAACAGPAHYPFQWSFHEEFNLNDPPGWSMVQYDLLELLVARGADVNVTHNEFTPLIALVLCDCEEVYKIKGLKLLLENGADPDAILPQWGYNKVSIQSCPYPVLSAVKNLGGQTCPSILVFNTSYQMTAGKQWSAISIAEEKGQERIRNILIQAREERELSTGVVSISL
jgi:ankyrin repeat protein